MWASDMDTAPESQPVPLALRIDLAEAFIELVWANIAELPTSRGGIIADHRYAAKRAEEMAKIDLMLDKLLPWYDERHLTELT